MKKIIYFILCLSLFTSGCVTRVDKYIKNHPDTPTNIQESMRNRYACRGMTKEQMKIVFGEPTETYYDKCYKKDVWVYRRSYGYILEMPDKYYLFENDKLVDIVGRERWVDLQRICKIEEYLKNHSDRSQFKDVMLEKKIKLGMNTEEVILSWGEPHDINRTTTANGISEQWVYGLGYYGKKKYLYFDDEILKSWQD